jgi:hypothetical protein
MFMSRLLVLGLLAVLVPQAAPVPSALESSPAGWVDLLADRTLSQWVRVPLAPVGKLPGGQADAPSPWTLNAADGILICDGTKVGHEMFRSAEEVGDMTLHVEWRFTKLEGEAPYNSGVFPRVNADGTVWFQAQTGPSGGYLFGSVSVDGKPQRVNLRDKMAENRVKPAGEWNTYEIRAVGRTLTLWVNGAIVNEYADCPLTRAFIGLEAEGYRIEFRNLKLKRL